MVFRYASLDQISGILLFFNLQQGVLRGILQALFPVFRIVKVCIRIKRMQTVLAQPRRGVPDRREGFAPLSLSGAKGV